MALLPASFVPRAAGKIGATSQRRSDTQDWVSPRQC